MQQNFDAESPLSNTGVKQNDEAASFLALDELDEVTQRGWAFQSWMSSCPVTGRVVRFDGINIQLPPDCLEEFMKFVLQLFKVDADFNLLPRSGSKYYKDRYEGPFGINVLANPVSASNKGWFKCDFLGRGSAQLELKDWRELILWIHNHGGYASSIQLNIDDYRREVTPLMMLQAVHQPGEKSRNGMSKGVLHFGTYVYHESSSELGKGTTMTFGKRGKAGGGKQYCCYDKNIESEGAVDCIRHELRLYNEKSREEFFPKLVEVCKFDDWEDLLIQLIAGTVCGSIDFRDVSNYDPDLGKLKDCPRFEWWENFVKDYSDIKLNAKKKNSQTFKSKVNFLLKQIAPSFATVLNCLAQLDEKKEHAVAFMWQMWLLGEEKMNNAQRMLQAEHKTIFATQTAVYDFVQNHLQQDFG